MTVAEIKDLIKEYSLKSVSNYHFKEKKLALEMLLEKADSISLKMNELDGINQAADALQKSWRNALQITKDSKYSTFLSICDIVKNQLMSESRILETYSSKIKEYDNFEDFVRFVKATVYSNQVGYKELKSAYDLSHLG